MWTDWSEMLVSKLRELKELGLSSSQIGDKLGLSKNAVIGKWNRLGESRPASSQERSVNARKGGKARSKAIKASKPKQPRGNFKFKRTPADVKHPGTLPPKPTLPLVMPPARGTGLDALLELQADDCRWPIGRPGTPDFRFCGATRGSTMYCEHHYVASVRFSDDQGS